MDGSNTPRTIDEHKVNPANDRLDIVVADEPSTGGASHRYAVSLDGAELIVLSFQKGPIGEVGVNGVTHEVLLAVLADRMRGFQAGPFACEANASALAHIEEAQRALQQRTLERMRRGVEGTHAT